VGAFNLSSQSFDTATLQVLNAGLKFVPTPTQCTSNSLAEQQCQSFARKVRLRLQFGDSAYDSKYHIPNPGYEPDPGGSAVEGFLKDLSDVVSAFYGQRPRYLQSNLNRAQQLAVRDLATCKDVVVKPSDKNLGMCIMDKSDYEALVLKELHHVSQFVLVSDPPAAILARLATQLTTLVQRWCRNLPFSVYRYLLHWAGQVHHFPQPYCLPKLHKLPVVSREHLPTLKGRLIVPSHSWVTYGASVYLADVLNEACAAKYDHILPDSRTLIRRLEGTQVSTAAKLVTFDVVAMYPSIDNAAAIDAACEVVPASLRGMVYDLLHFIMDNSYCMRNGVPYKQTGGTAMGTPCAVPYANIYFARCIEVLLRATFPEFPRHYFRLIDDGFFIWEGPDALLHDFLHRMNTMLPNISITWHISNDKLPYLDLWVIKRMSSPTAASASIHFATYQKPHNKYMYVPYTSHHRPTVYSALIKGELIRYAVTNTLLADYDNMVALFKERVLQRGYPVTLFDSVAAQISHTARQQYLAADHNTAAHQHNDKGPVYIASYGPHECTGGFAAVVNRVYAEHKDSAPELQAIFGDHITVAFKNPPNLSKLLVHAKD
jgi:hypothetical protein